MAPKGNSEGSQHPSPASSEAAASPESKLSRPSEAPRQRIQRQRSLPVSSSLRHSAETNGSPRRGSSQSSFRLNVTETHVLVRDIDYTTGRKLVNQYAFVKELGRGFHGKVKLAIDMENKTKWVLSSVEEVESSLMPNSDVFCK